MCFCLIFFSSSGGSDTKTTMTRFLRDSLICLLLLFSELIYHESFFKFTLLLVCTNAQYTEFIKYFPYLANQLCLWIWWLFPYFFFVWIKTLFMPSFVALMSAEKGGVLCRKNVRSRSTFHVNVCVFYDLGLFLMLRLLHFSSLSFKIFFFWIFMVRLIYFETENLKVNNAYAIMMQIMIPKFFFIIVVFC